MHAVFLAEHRVQIAFEHYSNMLNIVAYGKNDCGLRKVYLQKFIILQVYNRYSYSHIYILLELIQTRIKRGQTNKCM